MKTEKSANVINYELTTYYVLFLFFSFIELKTFFIFKKIQKQQKNKISFFKYQLFWKIRQYCNKKGNLIKLHIKNRRHLIKQLCNLNNKNTIK